MSEPDHLPEFEMSLGSDGVVILRWKPKTELTLLLARESVDTMSSLTGGNKSPLFVDTSAIRFITRDARELYVSETVSHVASAVALLVGSPLTRTLANFFLRVNKPRIPTRMFDSEARALAWLRESLDEVV